MESLLFHPKVVHLPMALAVLMPLVAGGLALAWWRGWLPARAWIIAALLQAVLVVSAVMSLRTGEADEEVVERVVAEQHIEEHEEAAQLFTAVSGAVLLAMVAAAALAKRAAGLPVAGAAALGTVLVLALGYRTGQEGGALVYRHGAAQAHVGSGAAPAGAAPDGAAKGDHHDDD